ncbi:cyanophycinase [Shewanella xiamenensis]|uniref:cyanophycinase n=1 Tax=Shewanella xiamenensis TaxID=332186 RepID=UPI0024A624DA|nr:cyanophycinase [Shewanella xiamenensis]MDI5875490.1 cyanophycinase [Shewanella xiamenensis]
MSSDNCKINTAFSPTAKRDIRYDFTPLWLERALAHPSLEMLTQAQQTNLRNASLAAAKHASLLSLNELKQNVGKFDPALFNTLDDKTYFALLDLLEAQQQADGSSKQEQVILDASRSSHTIELYRLFVQQALKKRQQRQPTAQRPLIAIVTASARDPLESAHFYLSVFEQAGAEVIWLPIDAALQKGIATGECKMLPLFRQQLQGNIDKQRLYPSETQRQHDYCDNPNTLYKFLEQMDGLFLNGGDQSLTLKAWLTPEGQPSDALTLVKKRFAQQQIVIGGTSAGTAVMTQHNMITGGTSEGALTFGTYAAKAPSERCELNNCDGAIPATAVTYRPEGGLGFFPFGILDTHFTERDRQLRLLILAANTGTETAFGIDENTALLVDTKSQKLTVSGQHGVWVIEQVKQKAAHSFHSQINAISHYLTKGSVLTMDKEGNKIAELTIRKTAVTATSNSPQVTKPVVNNFTQWVKSACLDEEQNQVIVNKARLTIKPLLNDSCQLAQGAVGYQSINLVLEMQ